jgi:DNA-binding MarR family transcriptional regulator
MLKRLEELGLITRERCHHEGRRKLITLTEAGIQRIRAALHIVFTNCEMVRAYKSMWPRRWSRRRTRWRVHHHLAELYNSIYDVAQLFSDMSEPIYVLNYEIDH